MSRDTDAVETGPSPTRARADPWAHRRGEPRAFAVLWIGFVLLCMMGTIGGGGLLGLMSPDIYRPAARLLLGIIGLGVAVVWPMVRLCQQTPESPRRAALADAVVVAVPVHVLIWPQAFPWMTNWPVGVVVTLAGVMTAWILAVGALLALAQVWIERPGLAAPWRALRRAGAMAGFVAIAAVGPLAAAATWSPSDLNTDHVRAWLLSSPASAVFEIARDRSWTGTPAALRAGHVAALAVISGVALAAWALAAAARPGGEHFQTRA